jgi:hypothetical protein
MKILLHFHGKNIYWNAPDCYAIQRTLPILLRIKHVSSDVRIPYNDNTITYELFAACMLHNKDRLVMPICS